MQDNNKGGKSLLSSGRWKGKISHISQLGGIETSVIDNGPGKGTRVAWVNTGGGLRFRVVLDRAMDIVDAFYNEHSLAWISHLGVNPPNPSATTGINWLNSFAGGLVTTCGLDHVGGPEEGEPWSRGLHGRISNIPANVESIVQPDPNAEELEMRLTGTVLQSSTFGPHLELRRTISATLGEPAVRIHDEVTNLGNSAAPHMLLYHVNFGWPLADEGAVFEWEGEWTSRDEESSKIFNEENDFKTCSAPIEDHKGFGEAAAFIDIGSDADGSCRCGILNPAIGLGVDLKFAKKELPWVTNWQHWGKNEYMTALEPGTHPPIGQNKAREQGTLIELEPGESRTYDLELAVRTNYGKET